MGKSWLTTLKSYYSKTNQLHVEGDAQELISFYDVQADSEQEHNHIQRRKELFSNRNAKLLKSKTIIHGLRVLEEQADQVELVLQKSLWKLYWMDQQFLEQEQEQWRQLMLQEKEGNWYIVSDTPLERERTSDEPLPPSEIEQVALEQETSTPFRAYNRIQVKRYAELWWNAYNPVYPKFEVDCTNFVSQCLHAGGLPMQHTNNRSKGWWVTGTSNWSYSWSVAHSLMLYLTSVHGNQGSIGEVKSSANELLVGDVICYDWDGDDRFQHNTIVVAKDPKGMPLVNAHTINSRHRYWDYTDSYAWTKNTKYKFIQIKG